MLDVMQNMMNEWMKNFSGLQNFGIPCSQDFMKNMGMPNNFMKNMNMGVQALNQQKQMFDNTYDMLHKIHELENKILDSFMANQTLIPAETLKMLTGWREMALKGQDEFKKAIDQYFKQAETYFANFDQSGTQEKK
jgi:hypothetical protein